MWIPFAEVPAALAADALIPDSANAVAASVATILTEREIFMFFPFLI
jgi:hypothetical protein